MKLSEIKNHLATADAVNFCLPDGTFIPEHFHVTEVGVITKNFIDCGGMVRSEKKASFQLWNANDTEHRLKAKKLIDIIALSEKVIGMEDLEIEVEYQSGTIGKYGLDFKEGNFVLTATHTDCLAKENCGAPTSKPKLALVELGTTGEGCCTPGGGCC
ncbi:MAG: hypothetical protein JWP12_2415 [Bacteroidetes bacterium]|nr:hypothetical protein [Bacteroidota bacterium]